MNTNYIPRKDSIFLTWVINFLKNLITLSIRIHIPEDTITKLTSLVEDFTDAYNIAHNPATRTKVSIQRRVDARKVLEKYTREIVNEYISKNHLLTNGDRETLGLPIPKTTRTPSPIAVKYPAIEININVLRQITIYFFPLGGRRRSAKPEGQTAVEIRWRISDTPIVDINELTQSSIDMRSPFTMKFEGHDRGKIVYFALRWLNTRGEPGPWTNVISTVIP
jgi:hypothetical protein